MAATPGTSSRNPALVSILLPIRNAERTVEACLGYRETRDFFCTA